MKYTRLFEHTLESRLHENLPFMQVVVGPRQVGKSTAANQIYSRWHGPKHFVSADDPIPKSSEWLSIEWQKAKRLGQGTLFIVDEIQKVIGWAETIKALYDPIRDSRALHIVLLGSASISIQKGLAASLAGRFELIKAPHWSYEESSVAFGWDLQKYLLFGGYPGGALLVDNPDRWRSFIVDSVIEPVLGRDIAGSVQIAKPALFRQLFEIAMGLPCQVISYNKLLGQLQDKGNSATIRHYLELLEGAFMLKLVEAFSKGILRKKASSPKLLPLAPALCQAYRPQSIAPNDPTWQGRILEAVVGSYLSQLPGNLSYWVEGDYEVDFVREIEGKIIAYEVKSSRKRKARSIEQFLKNYPKSEIIIIEGDDVEAFLKTT